MTHLRKGSQLLPLLGFRRWDGTPIPDPDPDPGPGPDPEPGGSLPATFDLEAEYGSYQNRFYVSTSGNDSNSGTSGSPFRTIYRGLDRAWERQRNGQSALVVIRGGVYREGIVRYMGNQPSNQPIAVVGHPGELVVMSGAEEWGSGWTQESGNIFSHDWPYDWGTMPNPWGSQVSIGELARRREMVIIDGSNLMQTMNTSVSSLPSGTFFVNETTNRLVVHFPSGKNPGNSLVEVGVINQGVRTQGLNNITWRNIRFQHYASEFGTPFASAVDVVDQNDVTLMDIESVWNGNGAMSLKGARITLQRVRNNFNGGDGINLHSSPNALIEDTEWCDNNWRGDRGGFYTWARGHKFFHSPYVTLRRIKSERNLCTGFWPDTDMPHLLVEDITLRDNRNNGIYLEALQSPVTIDGAVIHNNGHAGIFLATVAGLTMRNVDIRNNGNGQLRVTGSASRSFVDSITGNNITVVSEDWDLQDMLLAAGAGQQLISNTHSTSMWNAVTSSSTWNNNQYFHTNSSNQFQVGGGSNLTLAQWRSQTGFDSNSTFTLGEAPE